MEICILLSIIISLKNIINPLHLHLILSVILYFVHKLELLSFSCQLLALCKDYLNDRRQRIVLANCSSGFIKVTFGVPQ